MSRRQKLYDAAMRAAAPNYPPTHRYSGSNTERAGVGDPGHCEFCAVLGHVIAHPRLGCGDVGCNLPHDERSGPTHIGRSWPGATYIEDDCPCPKEPCGLVDPMRADPDCPEHPVWRGKSTRQSHTADKCPGARPAPARRPRPKPPVSFEFRQELPAPLPPRRQTADIQRALAAACREHPGMWTEWPRECAFTASTATDVVRGRREAFGRGEFEVVVRNGAPYIRYVGSPRPVVRTVWLPGDGP